MPPSYRGLPACCPTALPRPEAATAHASPPAGGGAGAAAGPGRGAAAVKGAGEPGGGAAGGAPEPAVQPGEQGGRRGGAGGAAVAGALACGGGPRRTCVCMRRCAAADARSLDLLSAPAAWNGNCILFVFIAHDEPGSRSPWCWPSLARAPRRCTASWTTCDRSWRRCRPSAARSRRSSGPHRTRCGLSRGQLPRGCSAGAVCPLVVLIQTLCSV